MQVVILAGGKGTRLGEETEAMPKPMIEIGGWPMLWHIMKIYSASDLNEFIICCGYKAEMIRSFFLSHLQTLSSLVWNANTHTEKYEGGDSYGWKVVLVDTGEATLTGGRIKRIGDWLDGSEFCMTYGDGVADISIKSLIAFHAAQGTLATVTAVPPPVRFGGLKIEKNKVLRFEEKAVPESGWINGGFFVLAPEVLSLIEGDMTSWERAPLETLAIQGQLSAFRHTGFWQPMDTRRDQQRLEELWASGAAPWKVWA